MAIVNICGFESGTNSLENSGNSGTSSLSTTTVRTGTYAQRCNPTTTAVGYHAMGRNTAGGGDASINSATVYYRFYFNYATKPSASDEPIFAALDTGAALKFELRLDLNGNLTAYDSVPTLMATGATVLAASTWYRIECMVQTGAAVSWEVRINGSTEISGTLAVLGTVNNFRGNYGKWINRNGKTVDFFYDDLATDDATWPGAGQCLAMTPDGDGAYTTWTIGAGSGSNWQQVDEIPHDTDTTYLLSTGTTGNADTVSLVSGATAGITGTVAAVKAFTVCKRNGASNGSLKARLRSASTDSDSSATTITSAYIQVAKTFSTDPATSAAWVLSALDSIEVGDVENSANTSRCTQMLAFVDFVPGGAAARANRLTLLGVS